jgi:hypothetical protein
MEVSAFGLNRTTRDWHGAGQQVLVAQASGLCAQPGWLRHQKPHSQCSVRMLCGLI